MPDLTLDPRFDLAYDEDDEEVSSAKADFVIKMRAVQNDWRALLTDVSDAASNCPGLVEKCHAAFDNSKINTILRSINTRNTYFQSTWDAKGAAVKAAFDKLSDEIYRLRADCIPAPVAPVVVDAPRQAAPAAPFTAPAAPVTAPAAPVTPPAAPEQADLMKEFTWPGSIVTAKHAKGDTLQFYKCPVGSILFIPTFYGYTPRMFLSTNRNNLLCRKPARFSWKAGQEGFLVETVTNLYLLDMMWKPNLDKVFSRLDALVKGGRPGTKYNGSSMGAEYKGMKEAVMFSTGYGMTVAEQLKRMTDGEVNFGGAGMNSMSVFPPEAKRLGASETRTGFNRIKLRRTDLLMLDAIAAAFPCIDGVYFDQAPTLFEKGGVCETYGATFSMKDCFKVFERETATGGAQPAAKKAPRKTVASKKVTVKKATVKKAAPKKASTKSVAPEKAAPKKTAAKKAP